MPELINIHSNLNQVLRDVKRWQDQIPFATARTINATALDFQRVQRAHMHRIFTVRRQSFTNRAVKIKPFANKRSLSATISIDPPGGQKRADIFTKFERDRRKRPRDGTHLSVPMEVRRTAAGVTSKTQSIKTLAFKGSGRVLKGAKRTYLIKGVGVFQRTGRRGRGQSKMLWLFVRSVPITRRLNFVRNARRVVRKFFARNWQREFKRAVATRRG